MLTIMAIRTARSGAVENNRAPASVPPTWIGASQRARRMATPSSTPAVRAMAATTACVKANVDDQPRTVAGRAVAASEQPERGRRAAHARDTVHHAAEGADQHRLRESGRLRPTPAAQERDAARQYGPADDPAFARGIEQEY